MNALDAMADDAIEIYPGTPNHFFTHQLIKGEDTKEIFENAAHVVEGKYYLQRQPHLYFEPDCGFAYTDEEGRLTIHSKSVALYVHAMMIAEGLGVEEEKLRMVQNNTGGTFGYKFCPTMEALVGAAHMATGRIVYLKYDYWMSIAYTGKRSPHYYHCKLAADENGKFLGMENHWICDHGPYMEFGDNLMQKGLLCGGGYDIPNMRGEGKLVRTNHWLGFPLPRLGLAAGLLRRRERRRRARPQDGHGPVRAALQEPGRARRHVLVGPGVRGLLVREALRHGQALLRRGARSAPPRTRPPRSRRASASPSASSAPAPKARTSPTPRPSCGRTAACASTTPGRTTVRAPTAVRLAPPTRRCARSASPWSRSAST